MNHTLVVIPARGGSKGIIRKNIRPLAGKPLIHYSIEVAKELFPDDIICVSTDDMEIKDVAEIAGIKVPFIRPATLATDQASTQDVILHALDYYENTLSVSFQQVLLLQPTSPFRTRRHLEEALSQFRPDVDMVVSVTKSKSNPYFNLFELDESNGTIYKSKSGNFQRRQDSPTIFELNGSIYVLSVDKLRKKKISEFDTILPYEMDEEYSVDIDDEMDWQIAEMILKKRV